MNILGLISFGIANTLVSMFCTYVIRLRYKEASNKYVLFTIIFLGYILFFYLLSKT
jgi:hypothetical protein